MAMLWRNHTDIPNELAKAIYRAVCPTGLKAHDVRISNCEGGRYRGRAYWAGSGYHASARPFIVVSVPRTDAQSRHVRTKDLCKRDGKGYLPMAVGSRVECLVMLLAHELRHLWQAKVKGRRVWGARGQFSERDCDAYALQMLRRYRRGELFDGGQRVQP